MKCSEKHQVSMEISDRGTQQESRIWMVCSGMQSHLRREDSRNGTSRPSIDGKTRFSILRAYPGARRKKFTMPGVRSIVRA